MSDEEKFELVAKALERIIAYIDPMRPRHWHVYPTYLRDRAVGALISAGYPVKHYDEYVEAMARGPHD